MNTLVSILAEIPEELHESLTEYLENHPSWDQDSVFAAALCLFLSQDGQRGKDYLQGQTVFLENIWEKN